MLDIVIPNDDDSVLYQPDNSDAALAKYEHGPDQLLSLNYNTEGRQLYLFDALGPIVKLVKPDASVQVCYQYEAFGNSRGQSSRSWNDFGFTGHEQDTETSLRTNRTILIGQPVNA